MKKNLFHRAHLLIAGVVPVLAACTAAAPPVPPVTDAAKPSLESTANSPPQASLAPISPSPKVESNPTSHPVDISPVPVSSPTPSETSLPQASGTGPSFAPLISGGEGGLYAPQDLSVIAQTGHIQFLNVYANW